MFRHYFNEARGEMDDSPRDDNERMTQAALRAARAVKRSRLMERRLARLDAYLPNKGEDPRVREMRIVAFHKLWGAD